MLFNAVCSVKSDMNLHMEIASATVIIFFVIKTLCFQQMEKLDF